MKHKTIFRIVTAILLMVNISCGDMLTETWEYIVDNPLENEIKVTIDGKDYTIASRNFETINLAQGKHSLTYNGATVNFVTKVNSNKSATVINPTLSNYILYSEFYVSSDAKDQDVTKLYNNNSYEYNSDEGVVKLPIIILNSLFIEKSLNEWKFGLNEDIRSKILVDEHSKKSVARKLYRENEFREDFAEELPEGLILPKNRLTLNSISAYKLPMDKLLCDCEAANEYVKELEVRLHNILAEPADLFQQINQLAHGVLMDQGSLNQECRTQYNPERDDTLYKAAIKKLTNEMTHLTKISTIIVE